MTIFCKTFPGTIKSPTTITLAILVCCLFLSVRAFADTPVGTVLTVKGIVTLQPGSGDDAYFLDKNSSVYEGDTIISTKQSFAVVGFVDESKVVIRQDTEFLVQGFSFEDGENDSTFNLIKGGIRAVTGKIARENPDNYKLDTPVATLGVRGTSYDARICDDSCLEEGSTQTERQFTPSKSECEIRLNLNEFPPGAYFTVREGIVVIRKGAQLITLSPGDVGFADETQIGCLPEVPAFMVDEQTPLPESDDYRNYSLLQCTP